MKAWRILSLGLIASMSWWLLCTGAFYWVAHVEKQPGSESIASALLIELLVTCALLWLHKGYLVRIAPSNRRLWQGLLVPVSVFTLINGYGVLKFASAGIPVGSQQEALFAASFAGAFLVLVVALAVTAVAKLLAKKEIL